MDTLRDWITQLKTHDIVLFSLGKSEITLWALITVIVLVILLILISRKMRSWVANRLLARTSLDQGTREAIGSIVKYVILIVGFMIIMETSGINLTAFTVLAGAVGVGIGFGLQNIFNNFVAGMMIMFERPIKIGDHIEVGGAEGEVIEIGIRRTAIRTNDYFIVIVPNSKFITDNVKNWNYHTNAAPIKIPVNIAAQGTDPKLAEKILIDIARNNPKVWKDPPPMVHLKALSNNAFSFELLVWSNGNANQKNELINNLNFAIFEALPKHNLKLA